MNGYEAQLKKLLSDHGWYFDRNGKGSHEIWVKKGCIPQTIPKACKSRHLANAILKQCKINHKF
jgi:predicted RNA binding protein YcfA (HicA-like mRNA interferase family)